MRAYDRAAFDCQPLFSGIQITQGCFCLRLFVWCFLFFGGRGGRGLRPQSWVVSDTAFSLSICSFFFPFTGLPTPPQKKRTCPSGGSAAGGTLSYISGSWALDGFPLGGGAHALKDYPLPAGNKNETLPTEL